MNQSAVLTPQEIEELLKIMKGLVAEGKSIIFITHKLNEIKAVADRCTVIRKESTLLLLMLQRPQRRIVKDDGRP